MTLPRHVPLITSNTESRSRLGQSESSRPRPSRGTPQASYLSQPHPAPPHTHETV